MFSRRNTLKVLQAIELLEMIQEYGSKLYNYAHKNIKLFEFLFILTLEVLAYVNRWF